MANNLLKPTADNGNSGDQGGQSARPLSHMEALQLKIRNRFKALHPQREEQEQN